MSFNKVTIIGNLGRDPELRYTPAGDAVCSFSVATTQKVKGEDVTTWFKVTCWRERAETMAKYLEKGSPIYVEGRLLISEWTDRDNNNRFTLEVTATEIQFLPSGGKGGSKPADDEVEEEVEEEEAPAPAKKAAIGKKKLAPAPAVEDANDDIDF